MSELEDIVPPLDLCMRICGSTFDNSALVWAMIPAKRVFWAVCERKEVEDEEERCLIPAPTLEEIFFELAKMEVCPQLSAIITVKGDVIYTISANGITVQEKDSAATAALKLWLELEEADK